MLPNSWLLEADAMTKREKKYKERLADAHRRATQKQARDGWGCSRHHTHASSG